MKKKRLLFIIIFFFLGLCSYLFIYHNINIKESNERSKIYNWIEKKIDKKKGGYLKKIFFPWAIIKDQNLNIKILEKENTSLKRLSLEKYDRNKYLDKILTDLDINYKESYEKYLKKSLKYTSNNSQNIIKEIKNNFIIKEELTSKQTIKNKLIVSYETIKHESLIVEKKNNKNLIIFISGHEPTSPEEKKSIKLLTNELNNYDVLYLSIFNRGLNKKFRNEISFKGLNQNKDYDMNNNNILKLYDNHANNINPLGLFLSGNYYLIKNALQKKKYDQVTIAGLSGGSISALFYGVLFDEINNVLTFDGVLPLRSYFFSSKMTTYFYYNDNMFLDKYDFDTLYFIIVNSKKNLNMYYSDLYWDKNYEISKNLLDKFMFKNLIIKKNLEFHDFDKNIILKITHALVVKLVDTKDLKSLPFWECQFESGRGHH